MYARIFGILSIGVLAACGGSGSNPITGASDDGVVNGPAGPDPNAQSSNTTFVFEPGRSLTANQFTYTAGATSAADRIVINNLPFDNVSSEGGAYQPTGVVLGNGQVFDNSAAAGNIQYLAVVQVDGTTGALIGAVGTDGFQGFGYGGAYSSRPTSALPPRSSVAYRYAGTYNGVRVIRQFGEAALGANNTIQLTTGNATLLVDIPDLDPDDQGRFGAVVGSVTGRRLFDANGNDLGALASISLSESRINGTDNSIASSTANTFDADSTTAQTGTWSALFSGPAGEQVVGLLVIEGELSSAVDPNFDARMPAAPAPQPQRVTGREVGGFIATRP